MCVLAMLPLSARAGDSIEVKTAEALSSEFTYGFLAGGVLLPLLEEDDYAGRQQALRTADALGFSIATAELLKRAFHQQRPDGARKDSFPSGHAPAAFAVATMQAEYDPGSAAYWYLGASAISCSRVRLNRHRVKDVVAGAALGYGLAQLELGLPHGYVLQPWIEPREDCLGVEMCCRF
jgi:hypothetical protein